jgi:hypothetical protein
METDVSTKFLIEQHCRTIEACANVEELQGLCRQLVRATLWQQALASQILHQSPP